MHTLAPAAGPAPQPTPEKKRARSDLEAIFLRYPNLAELKKPQYAAQLEKLTDMWYGSPAMREYGQMAWFILAYHVTGALHAPRSTLVASSEQARQDSPG